MLILVLLVCVCGANGASPVYRLDHVVDGDTIALRNGQRVRLVQIDTPEVYFGTECYGPQASKITIRAFTFTELREWLLDAGFSSVDVSGQEGEALDLQVRRVVTVAAR